MHFEVSTPSILTSFVIFSWHAVCFEKKLVVVFGVWFVNGSNRNRKASQEIILVSRSVRHFVFSCWKQYIFSPDANDGIAMIDWVSIVRHSRTRISNYVSPKRRSEQPHGRFMAYSDPPHMPFQPKSKVRMRNNPPASICPCLCWRTNFNEPNADCNFVVLVLLAG